ncbi:serine/threonine-protein kinase pim-2-like [Erpetoichthys calabaricus]|uniref:serine/threonine-protein kinase pim-2-like n=1 Tax=Erpetoichthys calabaricus TaxID=27687 RepID=UPI0022349F63|nr:serine/threonine-protein kinase pim-2-like [Erpetoichthys calabaricus]
MLDYVITPTYVIIVLQLLKSCMNLCQFLYKKKRVLGEEKVRHAFRQIVGAFLHCHTRGVLHNDIKLENILYQPGTGRIKLIDFGYGDILHDHDYTYPPGELTLIASFQFQLFTRPMLTYFLYAQVPFSTSLLSGLYTAATKLSHALSGLWGLCSSSCYMASCHFKRSTRLSFVNLTALVAFQKEAKT